jgi:hypothetical protein
MLNAPPTSFFWTFVLTEEYRLTLFGDRLLRKIVGPKREEVIGDWRKFHV